MQYKYKCIPNTICDSDYKLVAVQPDHIERIRQWRNEQINIIRQSATISMLQQKQYYKNIIWPDMGSDYPKNIVLAYVYNEKLVGYGALVHIDWENNLAESSFLLDSDLVKNSQEYKKYFIKFFQLLKKLAFKDLLLQEIHSETFSNRKYHIKLLENMGYRRLHVSNQINSIFHVLLPD